MPLELRLLAYSVVLLFVLIAVQAGAATLAQGLPTMAGNRDGLGPPKPFEGRTRRALYNHIEAMALFTPLALIIAVQGAVDADDGTRRAAVFLRPRRRTLALYLIGIPYVRTLVWLVSIVGLALIFLSLFGIV